MVVTTIGMFPIEGIHTSVMSSDLKLDCVVAMFYCPLTNFSVPVVEGAGGGLKDTTDPELIQPGLQLRCEGGEEACQGRGRGERELLEIGDVWEDESARHLRGSYREGRSVKGGVCVCVCVWGGILVHLSPAGKH